MSSSGAPSAERIIQIKESLRQDWTQGAQAWRTWNAKLGVLSRSATDTIVQAAQTRPGMQILDLASGTGEPALSLAEAVGADGQVTATDLVPEMLAVADEEAERRGLRNVTFKQADPEALRFTDASFDRVTCRFGVMFFPDIDKAFHEIHRVLKPGGRTALISWGPLPKNPYFAATMGVLMKHVQIPPPEPGAPSIFRFAQTEALSDALSRAGFRDVQAEERSIPWPWPGPAEEALQSAQELAAPGLRRIRDALPPEGRAQVHDEMLEAMRSHADGDRVNFTATVVLATGER
ncbi:MAG: class I SAM-dependent methyltransferase [Chloroflexota bacterium]